VHKIWLLTHFRTNDILHAFAIKELYNDCSHINSTDRPHK